MNLSGSDGAESPIAAPLTFRDAIVYEIYPKSFCDLNGDGIGDLPGITSKLDYLAALGVNMLWLTPIYPSGGVDGGYDVADYLGIDPVYGDLDDFTRLVREAHARGLGVMMDMVFNHTSSHHPWFVESRLSRDNPKRDWYIWRDGQTPGAPEVGGTPPDPSDVRCGPAGSPPNNWAGLFGDGPAWTYDAATEQWYLHLFSSQQPDLNWDNPEVRAAMADVLRGWIDRGVDGFRFDVISYISKPEGLPDAPLDVRGVANPTSTVAHGPHVHEYLRELRRAMNEPPRVAGVSRVFDLPVCVGEAAGVRLEHAARYAPSDGSELDMVFQFEVNDLDGGESDRWNTRRINFCDFVAVMEKWQRSGVWNALFLSNHDEPRPIERFTGHPLPEDPQHRAEALAATYLALRGTPFIYQGEELGMTNMVWQHPDQLRDVEGISGYQLLRGRGLSEREALDIVGAKGRDSARTPMQWNAEPGAGFTTGEPWIAINPNHVTINAAAQEDDPRSLLNYYRTLLRLRRDASSE
ncbi:MAG: alpha-glucosidase [Propionibacteriaceae bacterium]|nr:alpha-glucosidase [Propionibacteriaceae bacterium]